MGGLDPISTSFKVSGIMLHAFKASFHVRNISKPKIPMFSRYKFQVRHHLVESNHVCPIKSTTIPIAAHNHPLLSHNPHDLLPYLEMHLYADVNRIPDIASFPSPRLFATHMPCVSLAESVRNSSNCKLLYLCRNPKDTFVSNWHFNNKLMTREMEKNKIEDVFEKFCNGINSCGPFWDHVVGYWKLSVENPERVMFLKYEDMKEQPHLHLRRMAEFFNCPFTAEEEESGLGDKILKLCSFDHLRCLEVNKNGKLSSGEENNAFFRRGEVGDWNNYLSAEMVEKLDQITREKFRGTGLELL